MNSEVAAKYIRGVQFTTSDMSATDGTHAAVAGAILREAMGITETKTTTTNDTESQDSGFHSRIRTITEITTTTTRANITTKKTTTVTTTTTFPRPPGLLTPLLRALHPTPSEVFTLPEITEMILNSGISQKQLFVLQRVSKYFQAIIERSCRLRKTMFLSTVHCAVEAPEASQISVNPILCEGIRGDPLYDLFDISIDRQHWRNQTGRLHLRLTLRARAKTLQDFRKARKRFLDSTMTGRVANSTFANLRVKVYYAAEVKIGGETVHEGELRLVERPRDCRSLGEFAEALKRDEAMFQELEDEWAQWEGSEEWAGSDGSQSRASSEESDADTSE